MMDSSIATAVIRLTPSRLLEDFQYFGFLFESLCTRDLRVYAEAIDGQVFHYRDASGLESDTVVCLNDGRWAPIKVKLGAKEIEEAAEHLLELKAKVKAADWCQTPNRQHSRHTGGPFPPKTLKSGLI